ncbi:MAG: signal peptidase II [Candidatus Symbiobacter sp.]|nr:signal peptidase II [Candidatus Symbiobacter sp.]
MANDSVTRNPRSPQSRQSGDQLTAYERLQQKKAALAQADQHASGQTALIDPSAIRNEDDILAQLSRAHRAQQMAMDELKHRADEEGDDHNDHHAPKARKKKKKRSPQEPWTKSARRFVALPQNPIARRLMFALILVMIVVVIDQMSKSFVRDYLIAWGRNQITITPYFALVGWSNSGVSFGLFADSGPTGNMIFVLLNLVVSGYLLWRIAFIPNFLQNLGGCLVVGGALGNMMDRLQYGGVFDFLLFHLGEWYFPAFNFADTAITLGVVIMMLDWMFGYDVKEE